MKVGQQVTVRATALHARPGARVAYVGALVGETTRSAKARVTLREPRSRAGGPASSSPSISSQGEAEVPVAVSVERDPGLPGDGQVVFGRFGDVFEARPVELGRSDGERWRS